MAAQKFSEFEDLIGELNELHSNAKRGKTVISLQLWAIKNADKILKYGVVRIVSASEIPRGHITNINIGINLSKFVTITKELK